MGLKADQLKLPDLNQGQLLKRHLSGDRQAFAELMSLYRAPVYTYLVRHGICEAERDDLFQEIFMKIHRGAKRYDQSRALAPWVFTIVANSVRSFYRIKRVETNELDDKEESANPQASELYLAQQTAQFLELEIQKLPLAQREALLLSLQEDLSQDDIAQALKIPVNTVKTNLRRARERLSQRLVQRNATIEREGSQ